MLQLTGHLIHAGPGMVWCEKDFWLPGWQVVSVLPHEQVVGWKGSQTLPRWHFLLQMSKLMPRETVTYQRAGEGQRRDQLSSLLLCAQGQAFLERAWSALPSSPPDSFETNPSPSWIYLPRFPGFQRGARPRPVALGAGPALSRWGGRPWGSALGQVCLAKPPQVILRWFAGANDTNSAPRKSAWNARP